MKYYVGIDLGTSGVKGVVFDRKGNVIYSHSEEYDILSSQSGYAEQNPRIWLEKTLSVLKNIGKQVWAKEVIGIGLSGQMHGLVLLDKEDNPLRNAIIWCDNRTSAEAKQIEEAIGLEKLKKITGNIAMAPFTLAKLLWVKNHEPAIYQKIDKVLLPKDYIAYMLTKRFYTEYSDTSGMQIMNIEKLEYAEDVLHCFDIPLKWFAKLIKSEDIRGYITEDIQKETGLKDVFVCGGAGDQSAGAIGSGILREEDASIVLGSSGVVYSPTETLFIADKGEVQTFSTAIYGKYHIMGVTNGCGTSLKWLRDKVFYKGYNDMTALASLAPCGSKNVFYLPYLMGERTPILDTDAKGVFIGLQNTTDEGILIRSVMEGVGYSIKDCFQLIKGNKKRIVISGGGANSLLYRKIIASMIHRPVVRIRQSEGAALGAAILAMVAGKEYATIEEACDSIIQIEDETKPDVLWEEEYEKGYTIYKKIYEQNKLIFKMIKEKENEVF